MRERVSQDAALCETGVAWQQTWECSCVAVRLWFSAHPVTVRDFYARCVCPILTAIVPCLSGQCDEWECAGGGGQRAGVILRRSRLGLSASGDLVYVSYFVRSVCGLSAR